MPPPPPDNDDILREILIRLPTESLIRCRTVCKRWRAIIDVPPFARAHQHQPINKSKIVIQTHSTSYCHSLDLEGLRFSSNRHQTIAATPLYFPCERLWSALGACNGLVLTKHLEIWNPFTHERLQLHDLPTAAGGVFGLGYDYVADDYKAVSIVGTKPHQTHVYSLKSDSWRTIANCCPRDPQGRGVFVCGALNWISPRASSQDFYNNNKIIALDVGTEKYRLLQMPPPTIQREYELDVLGGCLILCGNNGGRELDVWVMKDYGDEGSWVLLFSKQQLCRRFGCLRPLGFILKHEEGLQVFLQEDKTKYFLFDVKTNTRKRVVIQGQATLFAQQMFPGIKFCLGDNCGGGARVRKTSTTTASSVMSNMNRRRKFVFRLEDESSDDDDEDLYI